MAKELPYFKFEPAEYLTKDVSFCSLAAQGLFINICAYYWQRKCKLTKKQLIRRLNYEVELIELINEGIVDFNGEDIVIKFLDAQLLETIANIRIGRVNGLKGGAPKGNSNAKKQPKNNVETTQKQAIREDKIREDKIKDTSDDVLKNVDNLFKAYLSNDKLIKAVIDNNSFKVKQDVENRLTSFNKHLKESGQTHKTWKDYASHFLNWHRRNAVIVSSIGKMQVI